MTQIKTFSASFLREAVDDCNDYLRKNPDVEVINVSTSAFTTPYNPKGAYIITLLCKIN